MQYRYCTRPVSPRTAGASKAWLNEREDNGYVPLGPTMEEMKQVRMKKRKWSEAGGVVDVTYIAEMFFIWLSFLM